MNLTQQVFVGDRAWRDGENGAPMSGQTLSMWIEDTTMQQLLDSYDALSGAPPSADEAQAFLRSVLDAILGSQGGS